MMLHLWEHRHQCFRLLSTKGLLGVVSACLVSDLFEGFSRVSLKGISPKPIS